MTRHRVLIAVLVLLLGTASAGWASTKFTCNSGGRTFSFTPGTRTVEWTLMTAKRATDCDIIVMDSAGDFAAVGLSFEGGYEKVAFSTPNVSLMLIAVKASGPNSKAYLRGADSQGFLRGNRGLRYLGSAVELAERNPAIARALERYWRMKPPTIPDE